jgi:hypothetical protein
MKLGLRIDLLHGVFGDADGGAATSYLVDESADGIIDENSDQIIIADTN